MEAVHPFTRAALMQLDACRGEASAARLVGLKENSGFRFERL
jgi:hypothetical protein